MDFENIYKSRNNVLKMLRLRGFDTANYQNQTKEELNILFQNHSRKMNSEVDSLDIFIEGDTKVFIKYILSEKCRAKIVEKLVDNIYSDLLSNEDTCIIISKDKITYKGSMEEYVNKVFNNLKRFVQVFYLNELLFDITEHELVPEYKILDEEGKKKVMDKYFVEEDKQLPYVLVSDPVARFYGVKVGELVEITDYSESNGKNKSYRLCVQ